eukprot:m51a1_g98 hypothetical protein (488) ;mRNA; f:307028-308675
MSRRCKFFDECKSNANVLIKHTGLAVCRAHFLRNIEDRTAKTIERYHMLPRAPSPRERWVIAMSGGKDSQVLAEILVKRLSDRIDFLGVYVDVGVRGGSYTDQSREIVLETCKRLNIPCTIVDIRADGLSIDDIHVSNRCRRGGNRTECAACGVVKRYHINRAAHELKADKVATGHHLTDEATTLLSNFLNINVTQLTRGMPWDRKEVAGGAALLPRVKPFLEVSEEETALYAHLGNVAHVATQCTYSVDATSTALKKHMLAIERERAGTMLRLVRGFNKEIWPLLAAGKAKAPAPAPAAAPAAAAAAGEAKDDDDVPPAPAEEAQQDEDAVTLTPCQKCGFPTTVPVCAYCKLRDQVVEFKQSRPELFGSGEHAHKCEVCCPADPSSVPDIEGAAGDDGVDGVTVTTDLTKKSNRWKKRQRQWERHPKPRPQATSAGAPAAEGAAAPAAAEAPAAAAEAAAPAAAAPAAETSAPAPAAAPAMDTTN